MDNRSLRNNCDRLSLFKAAIVCKFRKPHNSHAFVINESCRKSCLVDNFFKLQYSNEIVRMPYIGVTANSSKSERKTTYVGIKIADKINRQQNYFALSYIYFVTFFFFFKIYSPKLERKPQVPVTYYIELRVDGHKLNAWRYQLCGKVTENGAWIRSFMTEIGPQ